MIRHLLTVEYATGYLGNIVYDEDKFNEALSHFESLVNSNLKAVTLTTEVTISTVVREFIRPAVKP